MRMFFERPFMIISFSSRHRAQFRFPFLPAGVCLTMVHLIENCRFSFFRFQTCLDNSVSCLYFSLRRDFKWFLYLVLKSLAKYKHETELSKHVWNLKKENRQFSIRWTIVKQTPAGRNGKRNCALCLEEKLMIMKGRSKNILNRRSEIFTKCRHVI